MKTETLTNHQTNPTNQGEPTMSTQPDWALTYKIVIVKHGRFRYYGRLYTRLVCADADIAPTPWRETNYFTGITRRHTHYVLAKVGRDRARVWRYDQRHPVNPEAQAVA